MVYGVEVTDNANCCYSHELKTKMGILDWLCKHKFAEKFYVNSAVGWIVKPINNTQFVVYCRSESYNTYDKRGYTKLVDCGCKGSWEYWG